MDPIDPSSPAFTRSNGNDSPDTPVSETTQIGELSLSSAFHGEHDELIDLIASLRASVLEEAQGASPEPPSLESRLIDIAKSREPSNSFLNAVRAVGKKAVNMVNKIRNFWIWRNINPVRESATEAGGEVTFKFSQAKGKWLENMMWDSSTREGVCWALSLNWLKHRCQGTSLFHKIYNGPQKGNINPEVFEEIRALQEAGNGRSYSYYEPQWLSMHGMAINGINDSGPDFHNDQHMPVAPEVKQPGNFSQKLAKAITDPEKSSSPLKLITFFGHKDGHSVSAHIDPDNSSVTFFDPNFGEFRFPDSKTFNTWFTEHFWPKSKYEGWLSQVFSVSHVAPKGENNELTI